MACVIINEKTSGSLLVTLNEVLNKLNDKINEIEQNAFHDYLRRYRFIFGLTGWWPDFQTFKAKFGRDALWKSKYNSYWQLLNLRAQVKQVLIALQYSDTLELPLFFFEEVDKFKHSSNSKE